jgi:ABC-type molybdate transport system ATPase subunit
MPEGLSARNILEAKVTAVERRERQVLLRADAAGCEWTAKLTQGAARALGLSEEPVGGSIWLVIKTHALRRLR